MTLTEQILTVAICALGTMATRFLPFLLFSPKRPTPAYVQYLGKALPAAIFGMLVVYCLKNVEFFFGKPWASGASRHRRDSRIAYLEAADACVHRRRHGFLHGAGADGVLEG